MFLEDVKGVDPQLVAYLKQNDALVYTYPLNNIWKLILQKIRWASKIGQNPNKFNHFLGFLVLFTHFWSILLVFLHFSTPQLQATAVIFILFSRFLIDFLLLFLASRYFRVSVNWLWFLPVALVYSIYSILTAALSLVIKPNWK